MLVLQKRYRFSSTSTEDDQNNPSTQQLAPHHNERLKQLNLHSLESRSLPGELIEVFKGVTGIDKGNLDKVLLLKTNVRTRSNGYKLDTFRFSTDIGKNWFTKRVVDEWNN